MSCSREACVFINAVNFYRRGLEEAHLQDNTLDFCIPVLLTSGLVIVCLFVEEQTADRTCGGGEREREVFGAGKR